MGKRLGLRIEFQKCRSFGHMWDYFIPLAGDKRPAPWGHRVSIRCERCGAERHDIIDTLGQVSSRNYDYPDDYQMAADERPSSEQLRLSLALGQKDVVSTNGNGARNGSPRPPARRTRVKARRLRAVS